MNLSLRHICWMAWRHLRSKKRNYSGLSLLTMWSIGGVTIGVAALIVVLSAMGGLEQDLRDRMLRGQPHLEVMAPNPSLGFPLMEYPLADIQRTIAAATDVEDIQAFTKNDLVLKHSKYLSSATLIGIDPGREHHLFGFDGKIEDTDREFSALAELHRPLFHNRRPWDLEPRPGIFLGHDLARQLSAEPGDTITALAPHLNLGDVLSGRETEHSFVVLGTFRSEIFDYDSKWAVTALEFGRRFMPDYGPFIHTEEFVTGIAANLVDPTAAPQVEKALKTAFPNLNGRTWQTANKSLLFALKLEKFAMGSILSLIVLVAGFSISGTLMMTVFHKRNHVALLRAMGMTQADILRLYLAHGLAIGTSGVAYGLLIGLGLCLLIDKLHFLPMPQDVYYLDSLPIKYLPLDYVVICLIAWLFSLAAATYPALLAARQRPSEGLRWE